MPGLIFICSFAVVAVIGTIISLMIYSRRKESKMPDWYRRHWCSETDENGNIIWKKCETQEPKEKI